MIQFWESVQIILCRVTEKICYLFYSAEDLKDRKKLALMGDFAFAIDKEKRDEAAVSHFTLFALNCRTEVKCVMILKSKSSMSEL